MPDNPTRPSVNPNNRAYQHFHTLAAEAFELVTWALFDNQPGLVSLVHLDTGDAITLALLDSYEISDPHVLLAISTALAVSAHGPFDGDAPYLAVADQRIAATRPVRLHRREHHSIAGLHWATIPEPLLVAGLRPARINAPGHVLLLVDRAAARLAVLGPYRHPATAHSRALMLDLPAGIDPLVVPLLPTPPLPALARPTATRHNHADKDDTTKEPT
jgi:hypothetical protein